MQDVRSWSSSHRLQTHKFTRAHIHTHTDCEYDNAVMQREHCNWRLKIEVKCCSFRFHFFCNISISWVTLNWLSGTELNIQNDNVYLPFSFTVTKTTFFCYVLCTYYLIRFFCSKKYNFSYSLITIDIPVSWLLCAFSWKLLC